MDRDESPPRTPTGNAQSSESDIDVSSPSASHDESQNKDPSQKDSDSDPSHRPKRRRFHESYNFNMKCPTPGCNSLGMCALRVGMLALNAHFCQHMAAQLTGLLLCVDWLYSLAVWKQCNVVLLTVLGLLIVYWWPCYPSNLIVKRHNYCFAAESVLWHCILFFLPVVMEMEHSAAFKLILASFVCCRSPHWKAREALLHLRVSFVP